MSSLIRRSRRGVDSGSVSEASPDACSLSPPRMQALRDNFFYHSNPRLAADGGAALEDERQLLVEEQKLSKVRARTFSLETNRRRKALEERRKLWDKQEQRLRENILQQRRQRVQDATERFQRAHLPLSQRQRQSFRRNIPDIEDALNQIQGSLSSHSQPTSFLSSNFNISSRCTTSPKPPTVPKSSNRQALSAVEAYTKLLQEQSTTYGFKNTQEKQDDHNLQESQMSDSRNSESPSSKDSLEIEDINPRTEALRSSSSSFLVDSEKMHPVLKTQNDLYPTSDLAFSAMMLLGGNLLQATKAHEPKQKEHEESEGLSHKIYVSKSSWEFTSEQTPKPASLHNCNISPFGELFSRDPEHFDANTPQTDASDNAIVTNRPSDAALETSRANQEAVLDLRQQKANDDRPLKHPSATEILLPAKNSNSKDILFGSSRKPNIFLNDDTICNVSHEGAVQQTGKEDHYLSFQKEPSASINNLNKVPTSLSKSEKPITALQKACVSNIQSDALRCLQCHGEEIQKVPVRFIKGILKKHSKYVSDDATGVYGSGHLVFAEQVALQIRDSIELTRARTKHAEANTTVKKKLRWLDEVHMEREDNEQNIIKLLKAKSSILPQSNSSSEDHQPGPIMTPAASTGYHFTKHAWADVGVQVSLPQEQADEVPQSSTRTPKVPRRERSTRVGVGPVSSRTRKGTVIRPQSATEVSQITKTQGKLIVPRPPPRVEEKMAHNTKTPYGSDHAGVNCKQALAVDQVPHKDNSEGFLSPYVHHGIRTDSSVVYTALPQSSEGSVKGTPSSGHQETHGCSKRRTMIFDEKGLCLNCTPTDEEISQLWHGVRRALATKEAKAMLGRQALESGRAVRKPCVEQSRNPPASGSRRLPQPSQPTKQATDPVGLFSSIYDVFPHEGLQSAAHLHMSKAHADLAERDVVAAMETAQTQRSGRVRQCSQHQGLTTISLEEHKILLSLDRLNHRLHCVQEHVEGNTGTCDLVLIDPSSTKDVKASTLHKHRASSVSSHTRVQKKTA